MLRIHALVPILLGCLLFVALLAASSCGGSESDDGRLQVVATTAVIGALVDEVAGTQVSLTVLIPAGVDPHEFELRTSDRRAVDGADVLLRHGLGLDDFLGGVIDSDDSRLRTISDGASLREVNGNTDPHIWLDADNARVMLENVLAALTAADPESGAEYSTRAAAYAEQLSESDAQARGLIEKIPQADRVVVTNHDSLGYFLDRYAIESVGSVIPGLSTAAEPSARDVAELIELIDSRGVGAVLAEGSASPRIAAQLAADTGIPIVDDLHGDTLGAAGSGTDTLHGVILHNAERIATALQGPT